MLKNELYNESYEFYIVKYLEDKFDELTDIDVDVVDEIIGDFIYEFEIDDDDKKYNLSYYYDLIYYLINKTILRLIINVDSYEFNTNYNYNDVADNFLSNHYYLEFDLIIDLINNYSKHYIIYENDVELIDDELQLKFKQFNYYNSNYELIIYKKAIDKYYAIPENNLLNYFHVADIVYNFMNELNYEF